MQKVHFAMIGGFLGAGKTTCIARLAQHFTEQGKRVAIVTNDQAFDLVDTHQLRSQGFDVGEVPGSCFCCKFEDLVDVVSRLSADSAPDMILAEPVGSCTDLVATVIEPLRQLYGDRFQLGPLAVLLKPEHGQKILRNEKNVGFSPKAAYIFLKQVEEADVVAINKVDKLSAEERDELMRLVKERYPDKHVFSISARHGDAIDELIEIIQQTTTKSPAAMDVDYDIYAEGEAELGWLNCQLELRGRNSARFDLDAVVLGLTSAISRALQAAESEPAHLKIMGEYRTDAAVANLVDSRSAVELSLQSEIQVPNADLIINARVATDPDSLRSVIEQCCQRFAETQQLDWKISGVQSFRPGRPVPTHRMT